MSRPRPYGVTLRCSHPNTRANLMATKYNGDICRECNREHNRQYRLRQKAPLSATALSMEFAPPAVNAAIALYHLEKAKRAERKRPELEAAKAAFEAELQKQRDARKAGRPRAMFTRFGAPKPRDLADDLEPFTNRREA